MERWDEDIKCRACLSENVPVLCLFDVYEHDLTLAMILQFCLNAEVNENDGLPKYLCESCVGTLTEFYNFSVVYEQSVNQLKSSLQDEHDRKCDIPEYVTDHDVREASLEVEVAQESIVEDTFENSEDNVEYENDEETSEESLSLSGTHEVGSEDISENGGMVVVKSEEIPNESEEVVASYVEQPEFASVTAGTSPQPFPEYREDNRVFYENDEGILFEEITKYECKDCGDTFLYAVGIMSHMVKRHGLHDINVRDYCEKVMIKVKKEVVNEDDVMIEPPKLPVEIGVPRCQVCRKKFQTQEQVMEHLEHHKTFVCEICGRSYIKKSYLVDHKEAHSTDRPYKCKYCNKTFKRRTVLVKHKRIHTHPRQCVCEICGKRFNDKGTLRTHTLLLHIKERKFKCMICNRNFPLKATLDKHLRRHVKRENGEKDFPCTLCDMKYRDKSSLNRHVLTKHSGLDFKVKCNDCPKVYTSTTNLFKHRRVHHKEVIKPSELKADSDDSQNSKVVMSS